MSPRLPEDQRAKLFAVAPPAIGDIWLVPKTYVRFPGGKPRRCLVVALEPPDTPVRVHLIAGTASFGPRPARIVLDPDENNGLEKKTYFKFQDPVEEFSVLELQRLADRIGYASPAAQAQIVPAIMASNLVSLKQLTKGSRSERGQG